jgi:hypothetical protein
VIRHEANLAWALALAAKPLLDAGEHNDIFVAIGAGDTFAAIRSLLKWVAIKRIPVEPDLLRRCVSWLDAYVGQEDERYLRRLIEDFVFPFAIRASATLKGQPAVDITAATKPAGCAYQGLRHTKRDWNSTSGTKSADRAQLVHHVQRGDLVGLGERRVVEHRIH